MATTGIQIQNLGPENWDSFGMVLHSNLVTANKEASDLGKNPTTEEWTAAKKLIFDLLAKLGVATEAEINNAATLENVGDLQIGDLLTDSNKLKLYLVTGLIRNTPLTFPKLLKEDELLFNNMFPTSLKIIRLNYGKLKGEEYTTLVKEEILKENIKPLDVNSARFNSGGLETDSTHLQIGDLIFGVDPVQIAFTTQNGYQVFPTIRTDGNPKLSTGQQIKNINVSLIFPNVDAINNQLIPLYAMFRRTPFVNIKNREISKFFSDVVSHPSSDWIPVALESINVQSIDGFPNSLQADVSFLPIDPRVLGTPGLKALLSINDVIEQQNELNKDVELKKTDRQAAFRAGTVTTDTERFNDLIVNQIDSSEDFRESFPFRAFYQSLIAGRWGVKNEDGTMAVPVDRNQSTSLTSRALFEQFRPMHPESMLKEYVVDDNKSTVYLKYKYIPGSYIDIVKEVKQSRDTLQDEKRAQLRFFVDRIKEPKDLANTLIPFFTNTQDVIQEQGVMFSRYENVIRDAFKQQGWDISTTQGDQPLDPMLILWKEFLYKIGVQPTLSAGLDAKAILRDPRQLKRVNSSIMDYLYGSTILYTETTADGKNREVNITFEQAFGKLLDYADKRSDGKGRLDLVTIMDNIATELAKPLDAFKNKLVMASNLGGKDSSTIDVERLPIKEEVITIDNKYDVISSWSLSFSNKFVPFYLQINKYPFYQHLGFEDATLSLRVISVPSPIKYDLKAKFSELSDRMAESTKIVTYTVPELGLYMDPRVTIDSKPNSIFNAFGVTKVVLNSSNSTNRQGRPDSWNTVINLTQSKFSIDQYHTIEKLPNRFLVEGALMNLVLRLKFNNPDDPKGGISVRKFYGTNGIEPELTHLMYMSFVDSQVNNDFEKYVKELEKENPVETKSKGGIDPNTGAWVYKKSEVTTGGTTGTSLKNEFSEQGKLLEELYPGWKETDTAATAALQAALSNNKQLEDALAQTLVNYNKLLEAQAEFLKTMIVTNQSWFSRILPSLKDSLNTIGSSLPSNNAYKSSGLLAITVITTFSKSTKNPILSAIAFGALGVGMLAVIALTSADVLRGGLLQKFQNEISSSFLVLSETIRKELLLTLSHQIAKDPYIRNEMLAKNLIWGDRINENPDLPDLREQFNLQNDSFKGYNCYPDFDLNGVVATSDGTKLLVAPDFYLEVGNVHKSFVKTYIKDGFASILRTAQASMELCMLSRIDSQLRLNNLIKFINTGSLKGLEPSTIEQLKKTFGYDEGGIEPTLQTSVSNYISMALLGTQNIKEGDPLISKEDQTKIIEQLDTISDRQKLSPKRKEELKEYVAGAFEGKFTLFTDQDKLKYNYIVAQRDIILIELMEIFYSISSYFGAAQLDIINSDKFSNNAIDVLFKKLDSLRGNNSQAGSSSKATTTALNDLMIAINAILSDANKMTSKEINTNKNPSPGIKTIKDNLAAEGFKGVAHKGSMDKISDPTGSLSIPELRIFQNMIFNKIGYFIRLNTVIQLANPTINTGDINLDTLPELKFLDYFNRRELESSFRKLRLMEDFETNSNNRSSLSSRLFPTFKIMFIEEDGKIELLDDYYSFNAIQSIEIVKNKNMASSTAVLRLSNLTGSLTDRLSLHRENSDAFDPNRKLINDEVFFGTLNVKPGSKMLIKLGYGATDTQLKTVFAGRILEMNVGPVTEIICQSYGAQLRHEIIDENINIFSGIKEQGDIATSLLDKIPGLENFGSKELFSLIGTTSGRQFKNIRRNIFDRFVMSNLLGKVGAWTTGADNPRDENIYLPYDLSPIAKWDPQFVWKVYKQSVWDALQELCLYNVNTNVIMRSYNNDGISNRSEQRETIVIGEKSGYYKYTDAYSLSSLSYMEIDARLELFKKIQSKIKDVEFVISPSANRVAQTKLNKGDAFDSGKEPSLAISSVVELVDTDLTKDVPYIIHLKSDYESIWKFFDDKTNYVIVSKYLLSKVDTRIETVAGLVEEYINSLNWKLGSDKGLEPQEKFVRYSATFFQTPGARDPVTENLYYSIAKLNAFEMMLQIAKELGASIWGDMSKDSFYDVKVIEGNNDKNLSMDPRYKKIQSHHYVSDSYNLLNSNIILNNGFANMVNMYYFDNPKMSSEYELTTSELKNINVWPVKAFRDIKDEFIRPLNSYQKNIDTDWQDCVDVENKLKGYKRINLSARSTSKEIIDKSTKFVKETLGIDTVKGQVEQALTDSFPEFGKLNLDTPDWRSFPSFMGVGVNLLKKEVQQMYRGTLQIVGDPTIEPLDIIHLDDTLNETQGAVEVEEVIHTFTPDQGFTTTISPCLITYDRDPQQLEDVSIIEKMFSTIGSHRKWDIGRARLFGGLGLASLGLTAFQPIEGIGASALTIPFALSGLNAMGPKYHRFLYDTMIEIMGGDVINFTALIRKGEPLMCGFDGVDYTNLRTIVNHSARGITGTINRLTAGGDIFNVWLASGYKPGELGLASTIIHSIPGWSQFFTLKDSGRSAESIGFWETLLSMSGDFGKGIVNKFETKF